jgi:hypothetical protein
MARSVRIGNALGFWGDRISAAEELLAAEPDLDYLTLDFLAEVSMSILAIERSRDPNAGWPRDVVEVIRSLAPYWRDGGQCRLITNAGGLNPMACARRCQQVLAENGCLDRSIIVISGDDVLDQLRNREDDARLFANLDTGEALDSVRDRLVTANAYLGAQLIAEALAKGADIVITGRVADPSLTVAACAHFHGWKWNDWNRLAGATVAGHLIECGTQVSGGISTDWLALPHVENIGFPIVEVADDGSAVVTKPANSGGRVSEQTVKEQLVYEIGDPGAYLSPDVSVSFLSLQVEEESPDRIRVSGATGRPAPSTYKVSATYQDGFRAQGNLTIYGANVVAKARRAGEAVLKRLRSDGVTFQESIVECLGAGACHPLGFDEQIAPQLRETVLRIAVADESREAVEQFTRELMPLVTAGPQGTTGYADGRPRVHPVFRYWPCLIERDDVSPLVELLPSTDVTTNAIKGVALPRRGASRRPAAVFTEFHSENSSWNGDSPPPQLGHIAYARSGDKGIHANIGIVARRPEYFERLCREVTPEKVAKHLGISDVGRISRFELPNLAALNFVVRDILSNRLRTDAQGKALGQILLEMPIDRIE